jgi:hypothetical protein
MRVRAYLGIGWDRLAFFENQNVARYDLAGFQLGFFAVSQNGGFECDALFELGDDIAGLPVCLASSAAHVPSYMEISLTFPDTSQRQRS